MRQSPDPAVDDGVRQILERHTSISHINELRTLHQGPEEVLLALSVDFIDDATSVEVESAITGLEMEIKGDFPQIKRVFIEVQHWRDHLQQLRPAGGQAP